MEQSFDELLKVKELMADFEKPWFIAGGWALDLFLGHVTRIHEDIEITVFRDDQEELRDYLDDWEFEKVIPGSINRNVPWDDFDWLELPVHEVHARRLFGDVVELEILFSECNTDFWIYRRNLDIRMPLTAFGLVSDDGIPYVNPEIVLLFKAKDPDIKDMLDFTNAGPALEFIQRDWLKDAIGMTHPGHIWCAKLDRVDHVEIEGDPDTPEEPKEEYDYKPPWEQYMKKDEETMELYEEETMELIPKKRKKAPVEHRRPKRHASGPFIRPVHLTDEDEANKPKLPVDRTVRRGVGDDASGKRSKRERPPPRREEPPPPRQQPHQGRPIGSPLQEPEGDTYQGRSEQGPKIKELDHTAAKVRKPKFNEPVSDVNEEDDDYLKKFLLFKD